MQVRKFAMIMGGALFIAAPALAHPGHSTGSPAIDGLIHPYTGLDHMLAMTAVGLWAALRGGRALWGWPLSFVAAMLAGYGLGQACAPWPLVEPAIQASIIGLGVLIAANPKLPMSASAAIIAAFGLAHGFAHGQEAPANGALLFPLGFALSTASLHGLGLLTGLGLQRLNQPVVIRLLGGATALGGLALGFAA